MIVIRLTVHIRDVQKTMGASGGSRGLYTAVSSMLIESYALYAVAFLLYLVLWTTDSLFLTTCSKVLGAIKVRATFPLSQYAAALNIAV